MKNSKRFLRAKTKSQNLMITVRDDCFDKHDLLYMWAISFSAILNTTSFSFSFNPAAVIQESH